MNSQTSSLEFSHFPVMLSKIIQISNPKKGGLFVDCTFGGGGYSKALLTLENNDKFESTQEEEYTPKLFSDDQPHEEVEKEDTIQTDSADQLFDQETSEDEDFEIPAFLRRQKF